MNLDLMVTRIDGFMTTDGMIHRTEEYAIQHQKYLNIKKGIKQILEDNMSCPDHVMSNQAAYLLAEYKQEIYELLKKNL